MAWWDIREGIGPSKTGTDSVYPYQDVANEHGEEHPDSPNIRVETIVKICGKYSSKCHGLKYAVRRKSKGPRHKEPTVENSYTLIPNPSVRVVVVKYV